jgi:hypothetical protein
MMAFLPWRRPLGAAMLILVLVRVYIDLSSFIPKTMVELHRSYVV